MRDETPPWLAARAAVERLSQGVPVTALGVRGSRTAEIARIAHSCGYQAIWVDLEHSCIPLDAATLICATALDLGLAPFVRIPERDYGVIGRLLDGGAVGIIAPRVETVAAAQDIVAACRFPPLGHRSAIATLPHLAFQTMEAGQFNREMDRATVVQILIETPRGLENLEAIAALPGVDLVALGTNDLTAELGVPGQFKHPQVRQAHEAAIAACQKAGKPLIIGGVGDPAYVAELIRLGAAPFLFAGIDTDLLLAAARQRLERALEALRP
jgi:4-hydroxy-2-oxoheptanedioate aldolase